MRKPLSLRERALALLARREHSRAELARKLARHTEDPQQLASLLEELIQRKLLSDERYAEARAHTLACKFGTARIEQELRHNGVAEAIVERITRQVRDTEVERARAAWRKRFGTLPLSPQDHARQHRFLSGRGFRSDVIRQVLCNMDGSD